MRYPRVVQSIGRRTIGWMKGLLEDLDPRAIYTEKDISPYFWVNGTLPDAAAFQQLKADNWAAYRLG